MNVRQLDSLDWVELANAYKQERKPNHIVLFEIHHFKDVKLEHNAICQGGYRYKPIQCYKSNMRKEDGLITLAIEMSLFTFAENRAKKMKLIESNKIEQQTLI